MPAKNDPGALITHLRTISEFEEDVQFYYPDGIPEELSPVLQEYKSNIDKDTQQDPANLIGYLQTMQLAILSGALIQLFVFTHCFRGFYILMVSIF